MRGSLFLLIRSLMVIGYTSFLFFTMLTAIKSEKIIMETALITISVLVGTFFIVISRRYLKNEK